MVQTSLWGKTGEKMKSEGRFDEFWEVWLKKVGKFKAHYAFKKIEQKSPELIDSIIQGARSYMADCLKRGVEDVYIMHASTFLNGRRWEDVLPKNEKIEAIFYKEWDAIVEHVKRFGRYGDNKIKVGSKAMQALSLAGGYYKLCDTDIDGLKRMRKKFVEEYLEIDRQGK